MELLNTVLLALIAVTTSVSCALIFVMLRRNNLDRFRLQRDSKLKKITSLAQNFNTSCKLMLEISNKLRTELVKSERLRWNGTHNGGSESPMHGAEMGKPSLQEDIKKVRSLVEELRHSYIESYQQSLDQLLQQSSEAAYVKDEELSRLFKELVLLSGRLEEGRQKLDNLPPVEKARVLTGHFSRMSHYLYLLHETSQQIIDKAICLNSQDA